MDRYTKSGIMQLQSLPLDSKVDMAMRRIEQAYVFANGKISVSLSGGLDSTVLLNIVRRVFPNTPAFFVNTGLEYPEIIKFVRSIDNVIWLRPKMRFQDVIKKYGYPVVSKVQAHYIEQYRNTKSAYLRNARWNGNKNGRAVAISDKWKYLVDAPFKISPYCCDIMKKSPLNKLKTLPIIGTMACDSKQREAGVMQYGCNAFSVKHPVSRPLSMWMPSDIREYLKLNDVPYSKIYDMGYNHTGCMFCLFGLHMEAQKNGYHRFDLMRETHPKIYDFCMNRLGLSEVMRWYPERVIQQRLFV